MRLFSKTRLKLFILFLGAYPGGGVVAHGAASQLAVSKSDPVREFDGSVEAFEVTNESSRPSLGVAMEYKSAPYKLRVARARVDFETFEPLRSPRWKLKFKMLRVGSSSMQYSLDQKPIVFKNGSAHVPLVVIDGWNEFAIDGKDASGAVERHRLRINIKSEIRKLYSDPHSFFVAGPSVFQRSITRSGEAAEAPGTVSGMVSAVRLIYRRRILKDLVDSVLLKRKLFVDFSATIGTRVAGDAGLAGLPMWADGRLSMEVFRFRSLRFEFGAGMTYFDPGLSVTQAGDVKSYIGFLFSGRFGIPLSKKLYLLNGILFSPAVEATAGGGSLSNLPLELFASFSIPRGKRGYFEIRLKYFSIHTSGLVDINGQGNYQRFDRLESYLGPEFLWVWAF